MDHTDLSAAEIAAAERLAAELRKPPAEPEFAAAERLAAALRQAADAVTAAHEEAPRAVYAIPEVLALQTILHAIAGNLDGLRKGKYAKPTRETNGAVGLLQVGYGTK